MDFHLPFEVGQSAEAKSFQQGYRGAWFRCKIREIKQSHGHWNALLEYFDFPDEKLTGLRLYQRPPYVAKSKSSTRQLMLRPSYPPIIRESEIANESLRTEVRVVIQGAWQVGDLVDWWSSGCYWSGKLTKIINNVKARIELIPRPVGEGTSYEVHVKDLRPSLDWSPELGWTLPTSLDGKNVHPRAQLIQPINKEIYHDEDEVSMDLGGHCDVHRSSETEKEVRSTLESDTHICEDSGNRESSDAATQVDGQTDEDLYYATCPLNKFKTSGGVRLNSMRSDTLEAAVTDLEELRNKIKWLKQILESGKPQSNAHDSWEFVEQRASSTPK
ncbi:unnamed protein product [Cuscuta epithymum]|uniref:Agenet domain-containing protein n=1 Tax=Cuscuta epithymum TaxID=186058 RepID=A0AAV0D980_9ASTE|nr:unnamed protein product [Cuscuta epithymum]